MSAQAQPNGLRPIVDGFLHNPFIRYWSERYPALCLAEMETLRRAQSYRLRLYTVPENLGTLIQPYDTYEEQVKVTPGSFWWGTSFIYLGRGNAAADPAHQFLVRIRESCNDVGVMDDFIFAEVYSIWNQQMVPVLMPRYKPIIEPGLVNVEIARTEYGLKDTALACQLVLWTAEPCQVPAEMYTECENLTCKGA